MILFFRLYLLNACIKTKEATSHFILKETHDKALHFNESVENGSKFSHTHTQNKNINKYKHSYCYSPGLKLQKYLKYCMMVCHWLTYLLKCDQMTRQIFFNPFLVALRTCYPTHK